MKDKTEYCIWIMCNGGKPYYISTYEHLQLAKIDLYNMVELEKKRNRPYYVHNDFYENEYPETLNCKIFCIKQREISDWEIYSEEKEKQRELENTKDNNLILFEKYI